MPPARYPNHHNSKAEPPELDSLSLSPALRALIARVEPHYYRKDTILIHMKDGVCRQQAAVNGMKNGLLDMKIDLMPLGTGELPIKDLVANAPKQVSTIIVELDYVAEGLDMWESIEKSYRFMTSNGLGAGNK